MKKIAVLILVITIIFSGCNLFKKDPQEAVTRGIQKFAEVKKMSSLLTIKALIQMPAGETPSRIEFNVNAAGKSDATDAEAPKIDTNLKIEVSVDANKGAGELAFMTIDKRIFVNLSKLEIPGMEGEVLGTQLSSVLNKWWSIPAASGNPFGKLSEDSKAIGKNLKETRFFVNAMEDGEEEIQGMNSARYRVDLDKDALKKFIVDLARSSENAISAEDEAAIADSLKDMEFSGAVWIGEDDILHKLGGTLTVSPAQGPSSSFEINYTAWDYGRDISISPPESAQEFNPLMLYPLLGALGNLDSGTATLGTETPGIVDDEPLGSDQVSQ